MNWLKHPVVIALGIGVVALGFGAVLASMAAENWVDEKRMRFLYAAYTFSFIAFFFYLRSIDARAESVRREIENLRKELKK